MRLSTERVLVGVVLAISFVTLGLQAFVLRPHLWPAGAGLALSGDTVMGTLAEPRPVAVIRPPDVRDAAVTDVRAGGRAQVIVSRVWPGGAADRAGIREGERIRGITRPTTRIGLDFGLPQDPGDVLLVWRELQKLAPGETLNLDVAGADPSTPLGASGVTRGVIVEQPAIWAMDDPPWNAWLRQHLGALAQMAAFLVGAGVLIALGARGATAALMTLALVATAAANSGPLLGSHTAVPVLGPAILIFNWLITALSFPIIGLAVLNFPHRAEILDRHKWIVPAVIAASLPMLFIGVVTAAFLSGSDAVLPALSWLSLRGWIFGAAFAIPLAVNVLIVVEGISRYRINLDANERRRIQIVVFTGVPAVFAYALKVGIPLQAIVLLPAFGLPYAVAVRHVFSPRTVLRRGLQYAFARRTDRTRQAPSRRWRRCASTRRRCRPTAA